VPRREQHRRWQDYRRRGPAPNSSAGAPPAPAARPARTPRAAIGSAPVIEPGPSRRRGPGRGRDTTVGPARAKVHGLERLSSPDTSWSRRRMAQPRRARRPQRDHRWLGGGHGTARCRRRCQHRRDLQPGRGHGWSGRARAAPAGRARRLGLLVRTPGGASRRSGRDARGRSPASCGRWPRQNAARPGPGDGTAARIVRWSRSAPRPRGRCPAVSWPYQ